MNPFSILRVAVVGLVVAVTSGCAADAAEEDLASSEAALGGVSTRSATCNSRVQATLEVGSSLILTLPTHANLDRARPNVFNPIELVTVSQANATFGVPNRANEGYSLSVRLDARSSSSAAWSSLATDTMRDDGTAMPPELSAHATGAEHYHRQIVVRYQRDPAKRGGPTPARARLSFWLTCLT